MSVSLVRVFFCQGVQKCVGKNNNVMDDKNFILVLSGPDPTNSKNTYPDPQHCPVAATVFSKAAEMMF